MPAPEFSYALPDFLRKATEHALALLVGHSVSADLASMAVPDPDGMARLLALTYVWGDYAGPSARLLSESR